MRLVENVGGLLPLIGLSSCAATFNIYAGLYHPMIVASMTFIVGSLLLKETHGHRIWDEVGGMMLHGLEWPGYTIDERPCAVA